MQAEINGTEQHNEEQGHGRGMLVMHALHRCKAYKVGDLMFPGSDLSEDDMYQSLLDNGFTQSSIDVQVVPCPDNAVYGYSGILMASARKA